MADVLGYDSETLALAAGVTATLVVPAALAFRRWRRRPRLRLRHDVQSQPVLATMYWNKQFRKARLSLIRLDVCNDGRSAAEQVSVKLQRVRVREGHGAAELPEHQRLRNMPLAWSNRDFLDPDAEAPPQSIPANDTTQVDLVHVNEARPAELHLDVRPRVRPHDPQWLQASDVTLDLTVTAGNHPTLHYEVDVKLTAPWNGTEPVADLMVDSPRSRKE